MAMLASGAAMLPGLGAAMAGGIILPSAQHALRVFGRSSSFLPLNSSQPATGKPSSHDKHKEVVGSTNFACTFAPLARELTRTAGGFEHRARWPLSNGSSLLDVHLTTPNNSPSSTYSFSSVYGRRYSSMPMPPQPSPEDQSQVQSLAAATAAELPAASAAPGVLAAWLPKAQPRLKGFSRKLLLRQVNRKIIARVARRFTIGIPVVGFYFVSKLMMKDFARVKSELSCGQYAVAAMFSTALVADVFDLAAQVTIISGLAHANLGVGLAGAAAFLVAADKASLATAAISFSCGLGGELLALKQAKELAAGNSSD